MLFPVLFIFKRKVRISKPCLLPPCSGQAPPHGTPQTQSHHPKPAQNHARNQDFCPENPPEPPRSSFGHSSCHLKSRGWDRQLRDLQTELETSSVGQGLVAGSHPATTAGNELKKARPRAGEVLRGKFTEAREKGDIPCTETPPGRSSSGEGTGSRSGARSGVRGTERMVSNQKV